MNLIKLNTSKGICKTSTNANKWPINTLTILVNVFINILLTTLIQSVAEMFSEFFYQIYLCALYRHRMTSSCIWILKRKSWAELWGKDIQGFGLLRSGRMVYLCSGDNSRTASPPGGAVYRRQTYTDRFVVGLLERTSSSHHQQTAKVVWRCDVSAWKMWKKIYRNFRGTHRTLFVLLQGIQQRLQFWSHLDSCAFN